MKSEKIMDLVKGVWSFCSFLFIPQRRPHPEDGGFTEPRIYGAMDDAA